MYRYFFFLYCLFFVCQTQAKPTELQFWHAMAGSLGHEIRQIADEFNHLQNDYIVKPVYKGDYTETLTSFAAAYRAHQPPDMVQIFEVGTATMLAPKGIIKPVSQLMQEQGIHLPVNDFIPVVRDFYSRDGQLMALPLNLSAPVLFYNKDALASVGYSKDNFPVTWQAMDILAQRLKKAGFRCTYTSAYPAWVLVESYLAIHGLNLVEGNPPHAVYNSAQYIHFLSRLKRWQERGFFRYGGRTDDATVLFTSGICPLYSQSSGGYDSLLQMVDFHLGVAPMPLDLETSQTRHANVAGGAALWVVAGRSLKKEKGIARFLAFVTRPDIQQRWHEHSGYLPLGLTGQYKPIALSSKQPTLALAEKDLVPQKKIKTKPLANIPQHQIRSVNEEALEALFAGLKTPEKATQDAVRQVDRLIKRYLKNTNGLS